jgi:ABC-2 type transport system permease protein
MATVSVPLEPTRGRGWLTGFGNMLDKEYGSWWRTRRALVHLFLWLLVINGFLVLVGLDEGRRGPYAALNELIEVFFQVGGLWANIGIILATQSSLLGERQLGTAEWVLSKPVTREAFVLSKLLVNGATFVVLAVVVPSIVFFSQTLLHAYLQPSLGPFVGGLVLHVEYLLFYLALTLALGTFLRTRGAVSGTAIGLAIGGLILLSPFPWLGSWTPFALPSFASMVATGQPLPEGAWQPILVTLLWSLLFVLLALWRFAREEF